MRRSDRMAEFRAMTWSKLLPFLTPRGGPTKAEIMPPVIAVMSVVEIEPMDSPPTRAAAERSQDHREAIEETHRDRRELRRSGCVHTIALTVFASSFTGALP